MTLDDALARYVNTLRGTSFVESLVVSDWYSLFPLEANCAQTAYKWPDKFPNAGYPGVYLIFDAKKTLIYVGMTTRDVNRRLGDYFGYVAGRGTWCLVKSNMLPPWKNRPYYVRTIPLNDSDEAHILNNS